MNSLSFFSLIAILAILPKPVSNRHENLQEMHTSHLASPDFSTAKGTEYVHCQHPTRITDSEKSSPIFTQDTQKKMKKVPFNTTRILMMKGYTKNYQFYVSEIKLFANNPGMHELRNYHKAGYFQGRNNPPYGITLKHCYVL